MRNLILISRLVKVNTQKKSAKNLSIEKMDVNSEEFESFFYKQLLTFITQKEVERN